MSVSVADPGRRLDIGKVLTDGLAVVARNFGPFFLLALLLQGIPSALVAYGQLMAKASGGFIIFTFLGGVASLVTVPMLQGALFSGSMADLEGHPTAMNDWLATGRQHWLSMLGLNILMGLGVFFGMILLIVPGILLALRWAVSAPLVVLEGRGIQEAMGRSADLTKDRRWSIFLLGLILLGALIVVEMVLGILGIPFGGLHKGSAFATVIAPLINICTSVVAYPVGTALFRQLRGDKEGGNPEVLGEVFA
ncbi:MAG TPA: glycerophosphoryl diester phosphodiesterase membrane domain-containing protein [Caulobacteraceae bacterium]|jgi:hypothetical protein